jgi:hypothetical protein
MFASRAGRLMLLRFILNSNQRLEMPGAALGRI